MIADGFRANEFLPYGPAGPVDRILQPAGNRSVVFGRDEEDGVHSGDGLFEGASRRREVGVGVVAVERKVPERNLGQHEFSRRQAHQGMCKLSIDGGLRKTSDEVTDGVRCHG